MTGKNDVMFQIDNPQEIAEQLDLLPYDVIQTLMLDRNLTRMSEAVGIHHKALYRIRTGKAKQVTIRDWRALSDYFTQQFRAAGYSKPDAGKNRA